ncbi:hypothetical protein Fot_37491 [Forsythia ovata]|uniref:Uncharacterized protein n=1 Tax=Forsythia ovata TaxID=205694 RepID=A0ABD1S1G5_9LAMI
MLPNHLQRTTVTVDSFWTDGWASYSAKSSTEAKLNDVKAVVARSMVLIKEAEGSLNESKQKLRIVADEVDKLNVDLQTAKSNVAELSKRYAHATRAQELMAKAVEEANEHMSSLVDKVAEPENALDSLKAECS